MESDADKALAVLKEHPDWGRIKVMGAAGVSESAAAMAVKRFRSGRGESAPGTGSGKVFNRAIDAEEFRLQFDIPRKIREALKCLKGKIIPDSDFRAELGINPNLWRRAADLEEFAKYQLKARDKLYWGWPTDLEKIRQTMDVL